MYLHITLRLYPRRSAHFVRTSREINLVRLLWGMNWTWRMNRSYQLRKFYYHSKIGKMYSTKNFKLPTCGFKFVITRGAMFGVFEMWILDFIFYYNLSLNKELYSWRSCIIKHLLHICKKIYITYHKSIIMINALFWNKTLHIYYLDFNDS